MLGGFAGALPDTAFNARVTVTGVAPAGPYELRLQLLTRYQGATWAVSQLPVSLGNSTVTTDDAGVVTVPVDGSQLSAGQTYQPGLTLPAGTYAMTAQIIANGTPIGRATAAVFEISDPASAGGQSGGTSPTPTSAPPAEFCGSAG